MDFKTSYSFYFRTIFKYFAESGLCIKIIKMDTKYKNAAI